MPYHKELDEAYENARGKNKLGRLNGASARFMPIGKLQRDSVYELMNWPLFVEKFNFKPQ